jgi:hypothetical protein
MISDEPFLITAAHVVRTSHPKVIFRNGHVTRASVIRIDATSDVALLRVDVPPPGQECLQVVVDADTKVGASVYALGSPASQELSFSMSRGILSGIRMINGISQLQTDASINPGNSGGPLIDEEGVAIGVTSWKITGGAVEGIGFAVSLADAMRRLRLNLGESTELSLRDAPAIGLDVEKKESFVELADEQPVLNVTGAKRDLRNKEIARAERDAQDRRDRLRAMTPVYIPVMRWGGLMLTGVGLATVVGSAVHYNSDQMAQQDFQTTRTVNDIGWVTAILGVSATLLSFPLAPSLKGLDNAQGSAHVEFASDGSVHLSGSF